MRVLIFSQENREKVAEILASSGLSLRNIFNFLLFISHKYPAIFPSLDLIAKDSGLSKRQVQRLLIKAKEFKLLTWQKRHYTSNLYLLNPIFYDYTFRRMISPLFKVLQVFFLGLLISAKPTQKENVHVLNNKFNINNLVKKLSIKIATNVERRPIQTEKIVVRKPPEFTQKENMNPKQANFQKRASTAPVFRRYSQYQLQLLIDAAKGGVEVSQKILDDMGIQWRGDGLVREEVEPVAKPKKEVIEEVPYTNDDSFGEQIWDEIDI